MAERTFFFLFYLKDATTTKYIKRIAAVGGRVNIYKPPAADCLADFHGGLPAAGWVRRVALRCTLRDLNLNWHRRRARLLVPRWRAR